MPTKNSNEVWSTFVKGDVPVGAAFYVGHAKKRLTACVVSRGVVLVDLSSQRALSWVPTHYASAPAAKTLPAAAVAAKAKEGKPASPSAPSKRESEGE